MRPAPPPPPPPSPAQSAAPGPRDIVVNQADLFGQFGGRQGAVVTIRALLVLTPNRPQVGHKGTLACAPTGGGSDDDWLTIADIEVKRPLDDQSRIKFVCWAAKSRCSPAGAEEANAAAQEHPPASALGVLVEGLLHVDVADMDHAARQGEPGRACPAAALGSCLVEDEPHRLGEVAAIAGPCVLGRGALPRPIHRRGWRFSSATRRGAGATAAGGRADLAHAARHGAGGRGPAGSALGGALPALAQRCRNDRGVVGVGDTLTLRQAVMFLVMRREVELPALYSRSDSAGPRQPFGVADLQGLVGESPALWALRDLVGFAAQAERPVLLLGPPGSGKALAAQGHSRALGAGRGTVC